MNLARVVGTVVTRQTAEGLQAQKLLLLEPLDESLRVVGNHVVAVDTVQAGPGDVVFMVGSREAALACEPWFVPVDAAIVGIVDHVPG